MCDNPAAGCTTLMHQGLSQCAMQVADCTAPVADHPPTLLMRSLAPSERCGEAGNLRSTRRMRLYVSLWPAASKGGVPYRNSKHSTPCKAEQNQASVSSHVSCDVACKGLRRQKRLTTVQGARAAASTSAASPCCWDAPACGWSEAFLSRSLS